ncbi:type II toxin-antitoxin system RelE family toxin [Burkholderia stagnalis]|uniref:Type II toxin-antitoxin system RelE/ParE family toxin n=1 Tax=Burkholderia stagnalis TaxID=1503054 RepID=A0A6L3N5I6_9BURK|nr:type II toxin-antitoxin system RelE/ParE family toxin [Burkholderia stagnalis]KAB0641557.1 type II toxin-antitoxin system RelE/ParE family toxin [Burkholderia stagnalis]
MKIYELKFNESALKEWKKLDAPIREQLKKKLAERLNNPHVESAQLSDLPGCYKIKLRSSGYRLVYEVNDHSITVTVVSVGKREGNRAYAKAKKRLSDR